MDFMLIVFFISLFIILSGAVYKKLQSNSITEPFLALLLGVIVGPDVLGIIDSAPVSEEFKILETACQFTLAMTLMATALRIPQDFFKRNAQTASLLVIFGMTFMWLLGSLVFYLIVPNFSMGQSLLLGAVIAPTDPVVASTLTSGKMAKKYLPGFLRNNLSFESGMNDGLSYPIVFIALLLGGFATYDLADWTKRIFLYQNVLCAVLAYLVGNGAGFLMRNSHRAGLMNKKTILPFSMAVALFLLAGFNALQMNGIIAVFAGSLAFAKDITSNEELEEKHVQESMERLTTTPVFFILGLMLPWQQWNLLGWKAIAIPLLILIFRRIPAVLALMPFLPKFRNKIYSSLLLGWFGPIGVATLYYSVLMKEKSGMEEVWVIPSLIVVASTLVHGLTSVPLEKIYHRKASRLKEFSEQDT
ncbi:cation:proton antiporter domain-containing protein [Salegentibacter sediminis]|uniref:cation:proton antiporter domain-containing protein n=1 Tax=Salegentibacter sediminis TaxID=1930251 RepID=UPI0009BE83E6|nr:cation:proton antiporter [Salegentibacter sediminis]